MCNPVLAAVIGGGQAVLGHIGQVQAATQTNKNRLALYNAEKVRVQQRHAINIQNYYLRGVDAEETWADNTIEASLARQQQEMLLNEAIAESFRGMEGDYIKLQSDSRIVKYAERTGVTARRGRTAVRGALGRAQSARLAAVDRQHDRAVQVLHQIQSAKKVADRKADDMKGLEPERGPGPVKPKWDKGPSMLSLVVKTALGAYGGYKMGQQLQGLNPGTTGPAPVTSSDVTAYMADYGPGMSYADAHNILTGGFRETVIQGNRGLLSQINQVSENFMGQFINVFPGQQVWGDFPLEGGNPAWRTVDLSGVG